MARRALGRRARARAAHAAGEGQLHGRARRRRGRALGEVAALSACAEIKVSRPAPLRGDLMPFRQLFLDARQRGAERIRLVQAGAESVTTRPTQSRSEYFVRAHLSG